ncbi:conserved hypothetical protein [Chromobacterium violaceum ATCC 12472]|uniref:PAAR domain-containing protein n=2 Tax=Chromobacterium violaceum TaxID=536 RepID=Q7NW66_CHRVO|nr:conserved hypothetical protein [Chromobacterium violaceum ATCC 12472]
MVISAAMKPVIRLGDPTSHGGKVVSASSTTTMFGKAVALVGDSVTCPQQGHTNCVIVEGDPTWTVGGKGVALDGHAVSCGAKLISTLGSVMRSYEGSGAAIVGAAASTSAAIQLAESKDEDLEYFFVAQRDDGSPAKLAYRIDSGDEKLHEGELCGEGKTSAFPMNKAGEPTFWIPMV